MRYPIPVVTVFALTAVAGCQHVKPHPDTQAQQRYETYGPKFTEEEKAQMSDEEKVALYNAEVREEDRLVCRREKILGSHFYTTRCFTQKELAEAQAAAQEMMRRHQGPTVAGGD